MLKKYRWAVSNNLYFTSWLAWFSPITLTLGNVLTALFGHLYPDMTLTYRYNTTRAIDALVFHESAHYIHATKAGSSFLSTLARREVDNYINHGHPYYNGTTPSLFSGQLIALVEGYAKFMEHRAMVDIYNTAHGFSQNITTDIIQKYGNRLENFDMRNVPYDNAYTKYQAPSNKSTGWGLSGLFWDLYDGNNDSIRRYNGTIPTNLNSGRAVENVEGNQKAIFDLLTGSVNTGNDLKNAVKRKHPIISDRVDHLFSLYGY